MTKIEYNPILNVLSNLQCASVDNCVQFLRTVDVCEFKARQCYLTQYSSDDFSSYR